MYRREAMLLLISPTLWPSLNYENSRIALKLGIILRTKVKTRRAKFCKKKKLHPEWYVSGSSLRTKRANPNQNQQGASVGDWRREVTWTTWPKEASEFWVPIGIHTSPIPPFNRKRLFWNSKFSPSCHHGLVTSPHFGDCRLCWLDHPLRRFWTQPGHHEPPWLWTNEGKTICWLSPYPPWWLWNKRSVLLALWV